MNCCTEWNTFRPNKVDRIIMARQSLISTFRREALVSEEELLSFLNYFPNVQFPSESSFPCSFRTVNDKRG